MFNRRGQNIAEYSILIALVVGAAVAMQTYVKRGWQGRVKDEVDGLAASTQQYEPYYVDSDMNQVSNKSANENWQNNGGIDRNIASDHSAVTAGSRDTVLAPRAD